MQYIYYLLLKQTGQTASVPFQENEVLMFLRTHRNRLEIDQIFEIFTYTSLDEEHA